MQDGTVVLFGEITAAPDGHSPNTVTGILVAAAPSRSECKSGATGCTCPTVAPGGAALQSRRPVQHPTAKETDRSTLRSWMRLWCWENFSLTPWDRSLGSYQVLTERWRWRRQRRSWMISGERVGENKECRQGKGRMKQKHNAKKTMGSTTQEDIDPD